MQPDTNGSHALAHARLKALGFRSHSLAAFMQLVPGDEAIAAGFGGFHGLFFLEDPWKCIIPCSLHVFQLGLFVMVLLALFKLLARLRTAGTFDSQAALVVTDRKRRGFSALSGVPSFIGATAEAALFAALVGVGVTSAVIPDKRQRNRILQCLSRCIDLMLATHDATPAQGDGTERLVRRVLLAIDAAFPGILNSPKAVFPTSALFLARSVESTGGLANKSTSKFEAAHQRLKKLDQRTSKTDPNKGVRLHEDNRTLGGVAL